MRRLRYETHEYLLETFEFDRFQGKRILEIGCGGGIDTIEFARGGAIVTATDLTEQAIRQTRALANSLNFDVETRVADVCSLPFNDESFDHVCAIGVLHHVPEIKDAVREIHRVLKRGGTTYVLLYHRHSLLYYYSIIFLRGILQGDFKHFTEEALLSKYSEGQIGCPYTRVYTVDEVKELFRDFHLLSLTIHHNVYDSLKQRKVKFVGPSHLGWHLIIKVRKP